METIKFYEFKNNNFKGMVVVATKYGNRLGKLLNAYYGEETEVESCARSSYDMELFTSYNEVDLNKRLAIFEIDSEGISSGRQPQVGSLL